MSWYFCVMFFIVGCFFARALWMFFGPAPKTCVTPIIEPKKEPAEYRIVPQYDGRFQAERCVKRYPRDYWENASMGLFTYENTNFGTEKEAEAWIYKRLEMKRKSDLKIKQIRDFKIANPPREVPPFKYDHETEWSKR